MPYWFPVWRSRLLVSENGIALACDNCGKTIKTFAQPPSIEAVIKAAKGHKHKKA